MIFLICHNTCVDSWCSPSHSQCVGVLCSDWVIQHSLSSFSDSGGVSGPSDSGSRSTSEDTGEVELIVSLNYSYTIKNFNVTF